MTDPPAVAHEPGRLIYVDDSMPGLTRRRAGRRWSYFDAHGERICNRDEIDRLNAVGLPPAYADCWFSPAANGHILATGIDAKGRKQYRYHPDFRAMRESEKFDATAAFGNLLPLVRKRVESDLRSRSLTREKAIASVVRLLDTAMIRVGNEHYSKRNGSFGATTLRMRHVKVKGGALRLRFKAKSGRICEMTVTDRGLVRFVKRMQDLPGQHLFQYLDDDGAPCPIQSGDVNDYLRETMGEDFTAKNFRTWHASVIAFQAIAEARGALTMKALMEEVSGRLGNTPAIARKSYVHPVVLGLLDCQVGFRAGLRLPRKTRWMTRYERALVRFLEEGARCTLVGNA